MNFRFFSISSSNFAFFLRNFDEFFSGFRAKFQKRVRSVAFQPILRKRIRKLPKFQISEKFENYSILFNFIQSCPYTSSVLAELGATRLWSERRCRGRGRSPRESSPSARRGCTCPSPPRHRELAAFSRTRCKERIRSRQR